MCRSCRALLSGRKWKSRSIGTLDPGSLSGKWGIYALAVDRRRGRADCVYSTMERLLKDSFGRAWRTAYCQNLRQLERVRRIGACDLLYLGRSGPKRKKGRDLLTRYTELTNGGHTGWQAVWGLVLSGWNLRFWWRECGNPKEDESRLIARFRSQHNGQLPALNCYVPGGRWRAR